MVGYEAANGNIIFSGKLDDTHREAVLYHSVGPNASNAGDSEGAGAHIYDNTSVQVLPGDKSSNHPIYEDPTLSPVCRSSGWIVV